MQQAKYLNLICQLNFKAPPKKVDHEHLGMDVFVKTNPFGHMGQIRKGVRSQEYTFTRFDDHGRKFVTCLHILDPYP